MNWGDPNQLPSGMLHDVITNSREEIDDDTDKKEDLESGMGARLVR